jgi:hypothetical protein
MMSRPSSKYDRPDQMPTFTTVFTSDTTVRHPDAERIEIRALPISSEETVTIALSTEYRDLGFSATVPGDMQAAVKGPAESADDAIVVFGSVASALTPFIAFVANASVRPFEPWLAYESTPGCRDRPFIQYFRSDPTRVTTPNGRIFTAEHVQAFFELLQVWHGHREPRHLYRAIVHYQEALANWSDMDELRSASHLWMAVEALTPAILRNEYLMRSMDAQGLVELWGIKGDRLEPEVRRRLIFHDDSDSYRTLKDLSDALEHGTVDFRPLQRMAHRIRTSAADHIRKAIIDLFSPSAETVRTLLAEPPLLVVPLQRRFRGRLLGEPHVLRAEGFDHPFLQEEPMTIDDFVLLPDGRYDVTMTQRGNPQMADGLDLLLEAWATSMPSKDLRVTINDHEIAVRPPVERGDVS